MAQAQKVRFWNLHKQIMVFTGDLLPDYIAKLKEDAAMHNLRVTVSYDARFRRFSHSELFKTRIVIEAPAQQMELTEQHKLGLESVVNTFLEAVEPATNCAVYSASSEIYYQKRQTKPTQTSLMPFSSM